MTTTKTPSRGRLSRPARIADLEAAAMELAEEYQRWLDALPENLADGEMGAHLTETIEQLEEIAEALAAISPPRVGGSTSPAAVTP